jgi:hypothetical protein
VPSNQTLIEQENRRGQAIETAEAAEPPAVAQVRDDDLEPHAGLRYVARLFKVLALLLGFMLVAEVIIGFRQQGGAAVGTLLIEATRLVVFAGFLWGAGDMALMLIESNHDLRATRILVGRLNDRFDRLLAATPRGDAEATRAGPDRRPGPAAGERT